jgi:hypothetical protein
MERRQPRRSRVCLAQPEMGATRSAEQAADLRGKPGM